MNGAYGYCGTAVVVNDDAIQLSLLKGFLNKAGISVMPFETAENALGAMENRSPPAIIITDLYMPGIDGWRFCRLLRSPEYAAFNSVPLLVVSATFSGDHPEQIAADIGADVFLPAPVDGREFLDQVGALLTGKKKKRMPRVLIVEDSRTLAGLLRKAFSAHGYQVDTARTILDAVTAFSQSAYDVAVLDYHLPDGKGEILISVILDAHPECVCLMMTSDPTPELALSWMKKGASAYLRKPFEPEFLIEVCIRARRERALLRAEELLESRTRERTRAESEQEKLRVQLSQSQKIESIGLLAGGVAHDFNNMLGVILGQTELAQLHIGQKDKLLACLEEIHKAARRSADLTRQLLAFARRQPISPRVLDLNDTVQGMLTLLRRLIGEDKDLAFTPGRVVWPVFMDPAQMDQILANLCVNARDAISGVGKITIQTGMAGFDTFYCEHHPGFVPGEYVMLAVTDDGCGMDPETLSHVFEPFFTTKEVGKGTGLGLPTVYGAVKQNNGFINIYSEPGMGTTVKIYLPCHRGRETEESEVIRPVRHIRGSEAILLVEDEPMILEMTTSMLEMLGYAVAAASCPTEAMQLAESYPVPIDLLMTDVVLPEMNGRELARRITARYPNIRLLFMSGYTANVIAHQGVLEPGVHFIQKPFTLSELSAKIREALE